MLESYKWQGLGWMGWKSLQALILRAPLCGANNDYAISDDDDDNDYDDDDDFYDIFSLALPFPMTTQCAWSAFPVKRIIQQYHSRSNPWIHGL